MTTDSTTTSDEVGFRYVFYNSRFDNNPSHDEYPSFDAWAADVEALGHDRRAQKDGRAFGPVTYRPGATRSLAGVDLTYGIGLDVEHVTPERVGHLFEALDGIRLLAYTTHSHRPESPRWRVVIPLTQPVPGRFHLRLWEQVVELVGADAVDEHTKDASRLFYLPSAPEGAEARIINQPGAALDPLQLLDLGQEQLDVGKKEAAAAAPCDFANGLIEKPAHLASKPRPTSQEVLARALAADNDWLQALTLLGQGLPYAGEGARDATAHGCASTLAFVAPEADVEDIAAVFEASTAAMEAVSTDASNPPPSMATIREKIRRGLNAARSKAAADHQFRVGAGFATAIDSVRSTPYSMPVAVSLDSVPAPEPDRRIFHGLAGRFVQAIEPHTEASSVAILAQLIVAMGCIFGRGPYVLVGATKHYCIEFLAVVGRSARARKGTSWTWVLWLLKLLVPDFVADNIEHSPSSGEGVVYRIRDELREFDKDQGAEVVVDPGVPDKRLLIQMAEFALALQAMWREGNILSSVLRMIFDGENLGTLTKTSRCKATEPAISITAHITAVELRRLLNATEVANGLGNRFLYVYAERTKLLPDGGTFTQADMLPFVAEFAKVVDFASTVGEMRRDEAAKARWRAVYPELTRDENTLVGALTCRAEAHVLRLSMIYALLDLSAVIREEHLEAALAFWRYTDASCRIVFGDQLGDPVADALLLALRQEPAGLSRTAITKNVMGGHKKATEIARALAVLQQKGLVTVEHLDSGGRPLELWKATNNNVVGGTP